MGELYASFIRPKEINLLYLIPLFPLIGAFINGIFGKKIQDKLGKKANHAIAIAMMVAASGVALYAFLGMLIKQPAGHRMLHDHVFPMIHIGSLHLNFAFAMDPLSGMMTLIITLVGTGIHIYSTGYMHTEKAYWRFFCYLNLFIFSMLLLVLGDSFAMMFFGWEGVGLCSYLLIGFWYTDKKKASAGMKAFVVNRIGDFGFVVGLFFLFWGLGGYWQKGQYIDETRGAKDMVTLTAGPSVLPQSGEFTAVDGFTRKGVTATWIDPAHAAHHPGEPLNLLAEGKGPAAEQVSVVVGPTMSFNELRGQLSITDGGGRRPLAEHLAKKKVWGVPILFFVCLGLFIGACGKSAQLPLYVWLPDAMAGPTPVSALIHAATMVTAGVYMIARLNFLFVLTPGAMTVVALVGVMTALFAASIGLFQYDIKKVLAYSTVSQLGFMFIGVGVGAWWAGAFHLLTHALFKACLFLGSGSVIHGMHFLEHHGGHGGADGPPKDNRLAPDPHDPQDMRNMGGLRRLMPKTRWTYWIACVAISGFPLAAGFYSKDEILWKAFSGGNILINGKIIWAIGLLAATMTSFYMWRSYYMTFWRREPTAEMKEHVHESPLSMTSILMVLAALCLVAGPLLGFPMAFSGKEPLLERWLNPVTSLAPFRALTHDKGLEIGLMMVSITVAALGLWAAMALYKDERKTADKLLRLRRQNDGVHKVVYAKYYVDEIYNATVIKGYMALCRALAWFDTYIVDFIVNAAGAFVRGVGWLSGVIDKYGVDGAVNGVAKLVMAGGRRVRTMQTGRVNNYVFGIVAGVMLLFIVTVVAL